MKAAPYRLKWLLSPTVAFGVRPFLRCGNHYHPICNLQPTVLVWSSMPVKDLARDDPVTATRESSLEEVATTMRDEQVGSVIIENDRHAVGIVTDRDLALRTFAGGADPEANTAEDVMTEDPCCVDCEAGVFELTEAMCENDVRRVPVTEDGELSGIITLDDLSRLLNDEQQNLSKVIESESPAY